jgi:hypothetical protein
MKRYTTSWKVSLLLLLLGLCPLLARAQYPAKELLLFAYFKGNGEDGLHLAYSRDGLAWKPLKQDNSFLKPTVGRDRLMRDPSILLGPDHTYHLVWTVSWQERGIGYASSKDLIHWSEQKYIPVMEQENGALNCWAPELFYDAADRSYLIFWATTIPGKFPDTDGQDARGPSAPGWNHRIYYIKTRDFKTFSKASLLYERGFNVIDAAIIRDGRSYVMLLKDETNKPFKPQKNIRLAFSQQAEGPYSAPTEPITGSYWAEGPTAIKMGGRWFVYFDKYTEKRYGLIASTDLKKWTDLSDQLVMPTGMRHGTVIRVPEKVAQGLLRLE